MIEIRLKKREPVDRALKRLRRKMDRENISDELRKRQYYEKPSRKKYLHQKKAKYIQKLRSKKERDWG